MAKRRKIQTLLTREHCGSTSRPHTRRLTLERLEDRRLLAITVNTLVDEADGSIIDGDISLRDAITASPAGGVINFSVFGTIRLALGEVVVENRIIDGGDPGLLTIDAHNASRAFTTRGTTKLSGITITGGNAVHGGAIRNDSVLGDPGLGDAHLTVADCVITGNTAQMGGGIYSSDFPGTYGTVTVVNSTISGNKAIGIFTPVYHSGTGGGINGGTALVTIDRSTIADNYAQSYGGGVYGSVVMTNSTVSGNETSSLPNGAGLFGGGLIINSTISGNIGTGIRGSNSVIANSTITGNYCGIDASGTLVNSIVTGNLDGLGSENNIHGSLDLSASRNNLIGSTRYTGGLINGVNGNIVGAGNAGLGPLANNGGPTMTHALFSYSPAVNAGNNSLVPIDPGTGLPFAVDQTGEARIFGGGTVDMGAVEVQANFVPSTVVNTAADDVEGNALTSLREAIAFARTLGTPVTFDPTVFATPQTINLFHGHIRLYSGSTPLTVVGPGMNLATVDARGMTSIFVNYGTATISGLTITGAGPESAVYNGDGGTLNIQSSRISNNPSTGIKNQANSVLTVTNSIISDNHGDNGGGIYNFDLILRNPTVTISNSIIEGNSSSNDFAGGGGGIYSNGTLTVDGSTISANSAVSRGGGILAYGTTTITNTYIHHNSVGHSGGGIYGYPDIFNSTISENSSAFYGGGVFILGGSLVNSTVSHNTAKYGGGIYNGDNTLILNSSIVNNSASVSGGGVAPEQITLINSIIAGNTLAGAPNDVVPGSAPFTAASSHNLIGDAATAGNLVNGVNGNIVGVNPAVVFGPLADNGGPSLLGAAKLPTHALLIGSPAIDGGQPTVVAGVGGIPVFDERGAGFARIIGNAIDIGAFERQTPELTGDYNRNGKVDAADYVLWRNTLGTTGLPAFSGADGNGNGAIAPNDYTVWRTHFGESLSGAGAGASTVINPTESSAASAVVAPSGPKQVATAEATDVAEDSNTAIDGARPASPRSFTPLSHAEPLPPVRARRDETTSLASTAPLKDQALLAWSLLSRPSERPLTDNTVFRRNSTKDVSQADTPEVDAVDETFAGLASARFFDF